MGTSDSLSSNHRQALRCLRPRRDPRDLQGVRRGSRVPQKASKAGSLPSFTLASGGLQSRHLFSSKFCLSPFLGGQRLRGKKQKQGPGEGGGDWGTFLDSECLCSKEVYFSFPKGTVAMQGMGRGEGSCLPLRLHKHTTPFIYLRTLTPTPRSVLLLPKDLNQSLKPESAR